MAAYQVELTARARKQYTALDPLIRDRIRRALLDLAENPTPAQVKALAGGGLLRIRVGAWRVIYRVEPDRARVVVGSRCSSTTVSAWASGGRRSPPGSA